MPTEELTRVSKASVYPEPLIIPPLQDHKQTFIILHGRGSNATVFGPPLLDTQVSGIQTFRSSFPYAQFVFPTASKRRAQVYHRSVINQWFDNWSLQNPNERTELQIEGLRETSAYIHSLLRSAIDQVGAENVVLGGLSQGCAAALVSLLTWDDRSIAAAFGMCGWLPFRMQMEDIASSDSLDNKDLGDDDLFEASGEIVDKDAPTQATAFLCEELEFPGKSPSMSFQRIPIFLGHGVKDEKVPVGLGREAVSCLRHLGASVEWQEYEGLGHWYSDAMLHHLVNTLKDVTRWECT
ncbi:MAG: hypothetical protein LQ343_004837 [Gyalolechia ehrenbergii]|nr:MAG: hypothetical protein LQ343_004837 [Gyalolechia ehrenbergii]